MSVFDRVSAAFRSIEESVHLANAQRIAYYNGVGTPNEYQPYDASSPVDVAMDLAGIYATDGAANALAMLRSGEVSEEGYLQALRDLASGDLAPDELYVACVMANVAWRAGQPFRGLNRLERDTMVQLNCLPEHERVKDIDQLKSAASELLKVIEPMA